MAIGIEAHRANKCPRPKRKQDDRICPRKSLGVSVAVRLEVNRRHNGEILVVSAAARTIAYELEETGVLLVRIVGTHSGICALCTGGCLS